MKWSCPDIEKYQELLLSLKNDDYKIYANNVKGKIELYTDPKEPKDKYLITQAVFTIENPLFKTEYLLNHISAWIKSKHKDWAKNMKTDVTDKSIVSTAKIHVASHGSFIDLCKVSVEPSLVIKLIKDNQLIVSFTADKSPCKQQPVNYSQQPCLQGHSTIGSFSRNYNPRLFQNVQGLPPTLFSWNYNPR